jgi:hypothetical protein
LVAAITRTSMRMSATPPPRVGEGAAFMAKELALEDGVGDGRAGDVHERARCAIARVVEHLGGEILRRPALDGQQHRGRRAPVHFLEQRLRIPDRTTLVHNPIHAERLRLARAQGTRLATQPGGLERLLDEQRNLVEVERLVRVVIRAVLHRLDGPCRPSSTP